MTATHAPATGDRFLDTRGQCWTVLDTGQLQNTLAPGVLIRSWDSLDTCLGPLTKETTMPKPGDKYIDRDGDTWTAQEDGSVQYQDKPTTRMAMESAERNWGPLTPIDHEGEATEAFTMSRAAREFLADLPTADDCAFTPTLNAQPDDMVNHPPHYQNHPSGVECITVTEHMNFCIGNAMKYLWRAGEKGDKVEDLRKAAFYIQREIARLEDAA